MNTVYVVMKGYDYEGYTDLDMKVFANRVDAEAYAEWLKKEYEDFVDYVHIFEQEVIEPKTKASKGWSNAWPEMPTGH